MDRRTVGRTMAISGMVALVFAVTALDAWNSWTVASLIGAVTVVAFAPLAYSVVKDEDD